MEASGAGRRPPSAADNAVLGEQVKDILRKMAGRNKDLRDWADANRDKALMRRLVAHLLVNGFEDAQCIAFIDVNRGKWSPSWLSMPPSPPQKSGGEPLPDSVFEELDQVGLNFNLLLAKQSLGHLSWLPSAQLDCLARRGGTTGEICACARAEFPGPGSLWELAAAVRREAPEQRYPLPPLHCSHNKV